MSQPAKSSNQGLLKYFGGMTVLGAALGYSLYFVFYVFLENKATFIETETLVFIYTALLVLEYFILTYYVFTADFSKSDDRRNMIILLIFMNWFVGIFSDEFLLWCYVAMFAIFVYLGISFFVLRMNKKGENVIANQESAQLTQGGVQ